MDSYLQELKKTLASIDQKEVAALAELIYKAAERNKSVYIFGNGDSATNSFHISADLAKTATMYKKRLKIVCLNENIPLMTAWANDESYDAIFLRQLENFLEKDDLVIGISTSGNSPNVIRALEFANNVGAHSVALTAFEGGKAKPIAKTSLIAKTKNVEVAEDIHFIIGHMSKYYLIKKWSP